MNASLTVLSLYFPNRVKQRILDELAQVTAEGFEADMPQWRGNSFVSRRCEYAEFTAARAAALVESGDVASAQATRRRLFVGAERLGEELRWRLSIRSSHDAFVALRLLYKQLGIDVAAGPRGEIRVKRCLFSGYYSEAECALVSALDQGLVSGLFAGDSLEFHSRLTGGAPCCRATVRPAAEGRPREGAAAAVDR